MASLKEKIRALPDRPGVYLFKSKNGEIIYVGKAKSLRRRVSSYFKPHPDIKTSVLLERLYDIDYVLAASELDALILEGDLIKKYQPRYNVSLRDDKAYPYLKLTVNEAWPRLFLARRREKDGARYFGRYQGGMVRGVIRLLKKLFPIRWCAETPLLLRDQPCLYYRIGNCSGPCLGKISREDYREMVRGIILLLQGKTRQAIEKLEEEMERASGKMDFERAASLRDKIALLRKLTEGKSQERASTVAGMSDLLELQRKLGLEKVPLRIESFDISNLQGADMVGSMVAFLGGVPLKKDYRRFKIRGVVGKPDDVRAIYEVVKRRYAGLLAKKMTPPDLVVVDGGIAQVNFGRKALKEAGLGCPIIGLAKREEEIYFPGKRKAVKLSLSSPALLLLKRVRDEAHRFALAYHRAMRSLEDGRHL